MKRDSIISEELDSSISIRKNMKINFENLVFKKRIIFDKTESSFPNTISLLTQSDDTITVKIYDLLNHSKFDLETKLRGIVDEKKLKRYLRYHDELENWRLWFAYVDDVPVACVWLHIIPHDDYLYDSFIHTKEQLLFVGANTAPSFRGRRLFSIMYGEAVHYCRRWFPDRRLLSIVECSNKASIKANQHFGSQVYGKNYLIKIIGYNIISLFVTDNEKKVWWLPYFRLIKSLNNRIAFI